MDSGVGRFFLDEGDEHRQVAEVAAVADNYRNLFEDLDYIGQREALAVRGHGLRHGVG